MAPLENSRSLDKFAMLSGLWSPPISWFLLLLLLGAEVPTCKIKNVEVLPPYKTANKIFPRGGLLDE
jgi:hypothetical protein